MSIQSELMEDMKKAMKAGDKIRLETIRGLRAQIRNTEIDKGHTLSDEEVVDVLTSAAKKRRESIEQFKAGNRMDRVAEEEKELGIIQEYLPEQLSEREVASLIDQAIEEVNATSAGDMGKVMGKVMPQLKGRADGKMVQKIVQQKLATL